jgi:eukaryotic translation initiation factor 2C
MIVQGTSHFFQEGNRTETPEDHILQVPTLRMGTFSDNDSQYIKPHITFRDGVSEGQFYQVLLYELDAIRKVYVIR